MTTATLDTAEALAAADNDVELLQTLIGIYFEQLPSIVEGIQSSFTARDAKLLERNAHSLKGAISVFGKHPARDAALELEHLGKAADWDASPASWDRLREQLDLFAAELQHLENRLLAGEIKG